MSKRTKKKSYRRLKEEYKTATDRDEKIGKLKEMWKVTDNFGNLRFIYIKLVNDTENLLSYAEKEQILKKMMKGAKNFGDWRFVTRAAVVEGLSIAYGAVAKLSDLAKTPSQCSTACLFAGMSGNVEAGMIAAGKMNSLHEAGGLSKINERIFCNASAQLDSLSGKMPNG